MNTPTAIDRRELLKRAAYLMGGAISAPALLGFLQGCSAKKPSDAGAPAFLTSAQSAIVAEMAEILLPRSDTPGAKDAGVPGFIEVMLKDVFGKKDQERYLDGLEQFNRDAISAHGKTFIELQRAQQEAMVSEHHEAALADAKKSEEAGTASERPFILITKELTMLGFFTSEAGATQVLQYQAVPGSFRGCLPLSHAGNGKTWATEMVWPF